MINKWKKISSKKLFSHPRLSLYEDKAQLPNGKIVDYLHFGDMPDTAMVIAKREDGKLLMQKEYSYPPDEVLLQFPGGVVEKGEDPETGAARELAEEGKLKGTLQKIGWMYFNNRRTGSKMHFFVATNLEKLNLPADPEEFLEDHWLTEAEIDKLIATNEIRHYTALAGWTFYKSRL